METKPEMTKAELWRQLESMQAKMDAAIAERDTALAPPAIQVLAERLRDGVVDCTEALVVRHQENIDTLERLQRLQQIGALG